MCRDAYVWCVVVIKGKGRVERLDAYSSPITINKSVSGGSEHFPGGSEHFPGGSDGKESACKMGEPGSIPGLGRSPGEGKGNPLQYYFLENSMDRGAWQGTVLRVIKSRTQLSN